MARNSNPILPNEAPNKFILYQSFTLDSLKINATYSLTFCTQDSTHPEGPGNVREINFGSWKLGSLVYKSLKVIKIVRNFFLTNVY